MRKGYFYAKKISSLYIRYNGKRYEFPVRALEVKIKEKFDGNTYEITDEAYKEKFYLEKVFGGKYFELDDDFINYTLNRFNDSDDPLMWKDVE